MKKELTQDNLRYHKMEMMKRYYGTYNRLASSLPTKHKIMLDSMWWRYSFPNLGILTETGDYVGPTELEIDKDDMYVDEDGRMFAVNSINFVNFEEVKEDVGIELGSEVEKLCWSLVELQKMYIGREVKLGLDYVEIGPGWVRPSDNNSNPYWWR